MVPPADADRPTEVRADPVGADYDCRVRPSGPDILLAGGLAVLSGVSLLVQDAPELVIVAQVVGALSLSFRRTAPFVPPVTVLVATLSMVAAMGHGPNDVFFLVIWIVGSYGAGAYLPWPRPTLAALGIWWAALLLAEGAGLEWGDVVFLGALTTSAWVPGVLAFRSQQAQAASAALTELRAEQGARAVLDERARIARELHDVVAHAVGIMVVQAGAAAQVLDRDPVRARQALTAVQETGHCAIAELTRMLYLLREDESDNLAPLPSIARLPELFDTVTHAGVTIDVDLAGDLAALPPAIDLSAYRVVQEALTNAVKHAPGSRVHVSLQRSHQTLDIEVTDNGPHGPPAAADGAGSGLGLIGLRERVSVFGGHLEVGPHPLAGFRVAAHLPVGDPLR